MKQSINKKTKNKAETAKEMNAKDLSWQLFKKTGDINYYRLYSAIKDELKKDN